MTNLHEMLDLFNPILTYYHNEPSNVVIGGSYALIQHGLNIGREPVDLDIIIYKPTESQLNILSMQSAFQQKTKNTIPELEYAIKKQRSWKFKKQNNVLNILLEREKDIPEDLLLLRHNKYRFQIQSIKNVIDAKNSYLLKDNCGNANYTRIKDVKDFENLKKLNFNLLDITDDITDEIDDYQN